MFRGTGRTGVYTSMHQGTPITRTDAYKLSMAEAGAPLRTETFYYTHRRGGFNGWHYMPVDVDKFVRSLLPKAQPEDYEYLTHHGYEVGAAYRKGIAQQDLKIVGVPKGSWFYNREPAFMVKGTSVVVSWLEPTALMLQFRIQLATAILTGSLGARDLNPLGATCLQELHIIQETCAELGVKPPEVQVRSEEYYQTVFNRATAILQLLEDPSRAFEVGMRAVSCIEQHEIALQAIRDAGITRTSNVEAAQKLGMLPVGTMGHEHVQRMGSDYMAFSSMRDRFPGFLSYLLDTFDTITSGIPTALRVIAEQSERKAGLRFDSENSVREQYTYAIARSRAVGLDPYLTLESGWDYEKTVEFENLRKTLEWPSHLQGYGYGGFLVKPKWPTFERDAVAAVYKLCKTGSKACMKFGDDPGSPKQSIPGEPVIWRPYSDPIGDGPSLSIIAQAGEKLCKQEDYRCVSQEGGGLWGTSEKLPSLRGHRVLMSPETKELIQKCADERNRVLQEGLSL